MIADGWGKCVCVLLFLQFLKNIKRIGTVLKLTGAVRALIFCFVIIL